MVIRVDRKLPRVTPAIAATFKWFQHFCEWKHHYCEVDTMSGQPRIEVYCKWPPVMSFRPLRQVWGTSGVILPDENGPAALKGLKIISLPLIVYCEFFHWSSRSLWLQPKKIKRWILRYLMESCFASHTPSCTLHAAGTTEKNLLLENIEIKEGCI